MKGFTYAAAAAAVLAVSSVQGMESFLKQLPNGSKFAKALGHSGDSGYTAFGTAFLNAGTTWSKEFCEQTFPNSKITNGQAFGDPCCTWKAGAAAPQTVAAFTTDPGKGTTCASAGGAATPAPAGNNPAPAPANNNKPAPAPAGNNSKKPSPAPAGNNNSKKPSPAPAGNNTKKPSAGSGSNKPGKACKKRSRM